MFFFSFSLKDISSEKKEYPAKRVHGFHIRKKDTLTYYNGKGLHLCLRHFINNLLAHVFHLYLRCFILLFWTVLVPLQYTAIFSMKKLISASLLLLTHVFRLYLKCFVLFFWIVLVPLQYTAIFSIEKLISAPLLF